MNNNSQAADANEQGGVSSTHRSSDAGEGSALPPGANPHATFDGAEPQAWGQMWRQFVGAQSMSTFARAWLALQCERTDDVLGGLVLIGPADTGPYAPVAVWPEVQRDMDHLRAAAEQALTERRGVIERSTESVPGRSPTFHVAYPLEVSTHLHGVVVIEATARPEPELQAVLRELHWGIGWVEARLRADAEHDIAQGSENLSMLLALVAEVIEESRFQSACAVLVTELAERLGCDRVSIGFSKRQQVRVQAISHSATFGKEMNLVSLLGRSMDEAIDQECALRFPVPAGEGGDTGFLVTRDHSALSKSQDDMALCTVPISSGGQFPGAITLERPPGRPFSAIEAEACETLAALVGPILIAKRESERWIGLKAVLAVRDQLAKLFGPRHMARKLVVIGLALIVAFFAFATGEYRIVGDATLQGAVQRAIVAPQNGYLEKAFLRAGDAVETGQLLAALNDADLKLERVKLSTQRAKLERERREAVATRERAQVNILSAQIEQAQAQLSLVDKQLERLELRAPFDGIIVSGDLSQSLGAPVQRGDVLFEVAPLNAYRIILEIVDRDISQFTLGQPGEMVLSALPEEPLAFTVARITPVTTAEEGRNFFQVEAALTSPHERLRPGMEGIGKIYVDNRRLIWIWTRELVHWIKIQSWVWLR